MLRRRRTESLVDARAYAEQKKYEKRNGRPRSLVKSERHLSSCIGYCRTKRVYFIYLFHFILFPKFRMQPYNSKVREHNTMYAYMDTKGLKLKFPGLSL